MPESFQLLYQFFNRLTPISEEEWNAFKVGIIEKDIAKDEILLREGQVCKTINFIYKGAVRVYEIVDGIEINRTFFLQGFFATEYESFITQKPSREFLQALTDCRLLQFSYTHIQNLYNRFKSFERLGRLIAEHLYLKQREHVFRFQIKSPEERYEHMMQQHPEYLELVPHFHVASYLGIKPQSLSRIRARLKEE